MHLFPLILLILFGLVVLTGFILALIAGIRPVPRLDLHRLFPTPPQNEFFSLIRTLSNLDPLWHPGRGDLPDPTAITRRWLRSVQRALVRLGQAAGLTRLTPHVLRHTFAKNLVDSKVGLEKVAALLGHSNLNTTRIYVTPNQRDLEQAVEKLVIE